MEKLRLMVPCYLGVEKLVADELKKLKMEQVRAENGRVCCVGTLLDVARLNLNLRCGARVLVVLGEFSAISFEELYQGAYAIPWQDWIPKEGEFPVKGYSISSQLHSVPACQAIVKKAEDRARILVSEAEIVKAAQQRASEIVSAAQTEARTVRQTVTDYCDNMLKTTEETMAENAAQVRNVRANLRQTPRKPQ